MRQLAARPALLALVGALVVARLAWHPGRAICGQMTVAGCLGVAVLVVAALAVVSWIVRAAWLAVGAAREVAALPRRPSPRRWWPRHGAAVSAGSSASTARRPRRSAPSYCGRACL